MPLGVKTQALAPPNTPGRRARPLTFCWATAIGQAIAFIMFRYIVRTRGPLPAGLRRVFSTLYGEGLEKHQWQRAYFQNKTSRIACQQVSAPPQGPSFIGWPRTKPPQLHPNKSRTLPRLGGTSDLPGNQVRKRAAKRPHLLHQSALPKLHPGTSDLPRNQVRKRAAKSPHSCCTSRRCRSSTQEPHISQAPRKIFRV